MAFAIATPFFFLQAGALIDAAALWNSLALTGAFLGLKILAKSAGIAPMMVALRFAPREIVFTCLVMSSGLTFDLIVVGFGISAGIIDRSQYAALSAAVILSGVLPSVAASLWFQPKGAGLPTAGG
jgi:Kef-type K+ transport system membrane component KefB